MSQVVSVTTKGQVKNLRALRKAASRCGLEFREGQTTYRSYSRAPNKGADHAIGIPSGGKQSYEIGVVPEGNGWSLKYDSFQGDLDRYASEPHERTGLGRLMKYYHTEVAKEQAEMQGDLVTERQLENGDIELEVDTTARLGA